MKKYILFSLLILAACQSKDDEQSTETEAPTNEITLTAAQEKSFNIEIGGFDNQTVNETIRVNGSVEAPPQNLASVSFPGNKPTVCSFMKNYCFTGW